MAKLDVKKLIKGTGKLVSTVTVEAGMAYTASMAILSVANPVLGALVVIGSTIATAAACDTVIDPYVDRTVDKAADYINEQKQEVNNIVADMKTIKNAERIFKEKGAEEAAKYLKKSGYDEEQIREITKNWN